jgi:hypothetical protein
VGRIPNMGGRRSAAVAVDNMPVAKYNAVGGVFGMNKFGEVLMPG